MDKWELLRIASVTINALISSYAAVRFARSRDVLDGLIVLMFAPAFIILANTWLQFPHLGRGLHLGEIGAAAVMLEPVLALRLTSYLRRIPKPVPGSRSAPGSWPYRSSSSDLIVNE